MLQAMTAAGVQLAEASMAHTPLIENERLITENEISKSIFEVLLPLTNSPISSSWMNLLLLILLALIAVHFRVRQVIERSRRLKAERQLKVLVNTFDGRVEERTAELTAIVERLRAAHRSYDDFNRASFRSERLFALGNLVVRVAHVLNTPIGNALLTVSTLEDRRRDLQSALKTGLTRSGLALFLHDVEIAIEVISNSMTIAANHIANFKKLDVYQHSDSFLEFKLSELIATVFMKLEDDLFETSIELRSEIPAEIVLNTWPGRLDVVLTNLIDNAIRHGLVDRNDGSVHVCAKVLEGTRVVISVTDNGNGIPSEDLKFVFDPLFTTQLGRGRLGIGLFVAKTIVTNLMGGILEIESEVGKGTRVEIYLALGTSTAKTDASKNTPLRSDVLRDSKSSLNSEMV